jgi:hypothetical protein
MEEKRGLVSFLKSLTGDNVQKLAAEARAAKPGETPPEKDPASSYRRGY